MISLNFKNDNPTLKNEMCVTKSTPTELHVFPPQEQFRNMFKLPLLGPRGSGHPRILIKKTMKIQRGRQLHDLEIRKVHGLVICSKELSNQRWTSNAFDIHSELQGIFHLHTLNFQDFLCKSVQESIRDSQDICLRLPTHYPCKSNPRTPVDPSRSLS